VGLDEKQLSQGQTLKFHKINMSNETDYKELEALSKGMWWRSALWRAVAPGMLAVHFPQWIFWWRFTSA
jgi:hypothetical protein